ncbi:MAG: hypothetical protein VYA83_02975 [Candidatus Neomarinimicrobiota bacterium]|nr:hypothetical protein [Candidatus Neomarinimicrobiota bacterium]
MIKEESKNKIYSFFTWQNISTKLSAIALAFLLWLFVMSENEYTITSDIPIEVRNLPAQLVLKEKVPKLAKVRLKGQGRSLFKTFILKRFMPGFKLVLDLERISEEYDFNLNEYFDRYPQKIVIPSNFEVNFVEVVYPITIHISLDEYKEKMVNIKSAINVKPSPGFVLVGDPEIRPNKVSIAGSRNLVEDINYVLVGPDSLINIDSDIKLTLDLIPPQNQLIEYNPKKIVYTQSVQAISERIISEIPVIIINPNNQMRTFASPQTVSLTVIGGLDYIAKIKPNEIKVSVNFNDWNPDKQFYDLDVETPKDVIDWMDLSPKNIELMVTQKNN